MILYMNSVVAAQEAYRRGVVFEAQHFDYEPFYTATQYGGAISATSSAMLRGTATTRLGVATAQVLYIVEEKPIALKKGKGAARGV